MMNWLLTGEAGPPLLFLVLFAVGLLLLKLEERRDARRLAAYRRQLGLDLDEDK